MKQLVMNPFDDMQAFVRIVEAGSITKAAEQMELVKSALSRRLTGLEQRLGVSLLTRTTRTQTLTDAGRSYYQQSLRIIDDLAEIESSIKNENCALTGKVRVAVPYSFGLKHLAPAFQLFNDQHPKIELEVDFNDRKVDLIEEGFDLAIRIAELSDSRLIARKLTYTETLICASPGYLLQHGVPHSINDLQDGHIKVRYTLAPEQWHLTTQDQKRINLKMPTAASANNGEYLLEQAIAGRGLIISPDFICYEAVRSGLLVPVLTNEFKRQRINAFAIYPHTRHLSLRVRQLVDFLVEYFGETPYWRIE